MRPSLIFLLCLAGCEHSAALKHKCPDCGGRVAQRPLRVVMLKEDGQQRLIDSYERQHYEHIFLHDGKAYVEIGRQHLVLLEPNGKLGGYIRDHERDQGFYVGWRPLCPELEPYYQLTLWKP
jgi:hypothetical protein